MKKILIVDKTTAAAMKFLDALRCDDVHLTFTHQVIQALKNVKKNDYDLVILGDRADDGKVYDVALEMRASRKNKHTAVVCVGINKGKVAKIIKVLKPYALDSNGDMFDVAVNKVRAHFKSKEEQSVS